MNPDCFIVRPRDKGIVFVRTESRYFNITESQQPLANGHIDENDGLIPDAVHVSAQEVADLVAESRARVEQLERVESLLEQWIDLRRFRSRRAKQRFSIQKKEVRK